MWIRRKCATTNKWNKICLALCFSSSFGPTKFHTGKAIMRHQHCNHPDIKIIKEINIGNQIRNFYKKVSTSKWDCLRNWTYNWLIIWMNGHDVIHGSCIHLDSLRNEMYKHGGAGSILIWILANLLLVIFWKRQQIKKIWTKNSGQC